MPSTHLSFGLVLALLSVNTAGRMLGPRATPHGTHPSIPKPTGPTPYCASTDSTILNGDFESGSLGPWNLGHGIRSNSSASIVSPGYNSNYAAQISGNWDFGLRQFFIPDCEATKYKVDFAYKVVAASSTCVIHVSSTHRTQPSGGFYIPSQPGDWTQASFTLSTIIADSFGIIANVYCDDDQEQATLQLDDFVVSKLGSTDPSDCPRAVTVPDGDFDDGSLDSWQVYTPAIAPQQSFVSPGYDGSSYAVQLDFPEITKSAASWSIFQNLSNLCAAYEYEFSWAVDWGSYNYVADQHGDGCYVDVEAFDCTGKPQQFFQPPAANSGWQEYSFTCRPSQSAPTIFMFDVECMSVNGANIPPFSLKVDSFEVALTT